NARGALSRLRPYHAPPGEERRGDMVVGHVGLGLVQREDGWHIAREGRHVDGSMQCIRTSASNEARQHELFPERTHDQVLPAYRTRHKTDTLGTRRKQLATG